MRALVFLLLAGCSSLLGINDVTRSDAGGSGMPDAPVAPPNTVVGKTVLRFWTVAGMVDVPRDLSGLVVQALIPDAGQPSGFQTVVGSGKADGSFTISPVPDGAEYYLQLDKSYYVTSLHVLDIHFLEEYRGSPAPEVATGPTTLMFNLTNMQPYLQGHNQIYDYIEVDSWSLGIQGQAAPDKTGAIALTTSYDWSMNPSFWTGTPMLPDATQMDDVSILHLRPDIVKGTIRNHPITHVVDYFAPASLTLHSGASVPVAGSFTPVTANKSVTVQMLRGEFDSGYDGTSQFSDAFVSLLAHPVLNDAFVGSSLASIDFTDWSRNATTTETVTAMYGDPFPASWSRLYITEYDRFRYVLFPGTTTPRPVFGFMARQAPYTGGAPNVHPTLLPPPNIKVGGKDFTAGGMIHFDGTAPVTITWGAVATAKQYQVVIARVFANGTQTRTQTAGAVLTSGTSVSLPASLFSGGNYFVFTVQAIQAPNDVATGDLIPNGNPGQQASIASGMFRLSATCGDSHVDPGEDCDTGGESATCDADCTTVKCGDGLRNAAANEACDTIRDTPGCDSDCTLPVCGDGHINANTEDCDDGNTVDSMNGCSTDCHFNNICGNNHVENLVEACDTGGVDTAMCDSDCTTAFCGDGHVNIAAGEQCDEGGPSLHCDSTCHNIP